MDVYLSSLRAFQEFHQRTMLRTAGETVEGLEQLRAFRGTSLAGRTLRFWDELIQRAQWVEPMPPLFTGIPSAPFLTGGYDG